MTPRDPGDTFDLRSAVSICLGSGFQIAIYWGPDRALIYNDDWSPIRGQLLAMHSVVDVTQHREAKQCSVAATRNWKHWSRGGSGEYWTKREGMHVQR